VSAYIRNNEAKPPDKFHQQSVGFVQELAKSLWLLSSEEEKNSLRASAHARLIRLIPGQYKSHDVDDWVLAFLRQLIRGQISKQQQAQMSLPTINPSASWEGISSAAVSAPITINNVTDVFGGASNGNGDSAQLWDGPYDDSASDSGDDNHDNSPGMLICPSCFFKSPTLPGWFYHTSHRICQNQLWDLYAEWRCQNCDEIFTTERDVEYHKLKEVCSGEENTSAIIASRRLPFLVDILPRFMKITKDTAPLEIQDRLMSTYSVKASVEQCQEALGEILKQQRQETGEDRPNAVQRQPQDMRQQGPGSYGVNYRY
jgi:hypothetical protein